MVADGQQRLPPTGPAAVQRDWDGTPMPTDMMNDETPQFLAQVLQPGVVQMTLTTDDIKHDLAHLEEIASIKSVLYYTMWFGFEDKPHVIDVRSNGLSAVESGIPSMDGGYK